MNFIERTFTSIFFSTIVCISIFTSNHSAQTWRDIKPIQSTCKDVERVFGVDACNKGSISQKLQDEYITFVFAEGRCSEKCANEEYDVPSGTITEILVILRYPKRIFISDLNIDASKFQKGTAGDHLNTFEYVSSELGIKFTASGKGQVSDITYFPSSSYKNLRCQNSEKQ